MALNLEALTKVEQEFSNRVQPQLKKDSRKMGKFLLRRGKSRWGGAPPTGKGLAELAAGAGFGICLKQRLFGIRLLSCLFGGDGLGGVFGGVLGEWLGGSPTAPTL